MSKIGAETISEGVSFPCHSDSEETNERTQETSNGCHCVEISKAEEITNHLQFGNLLRSSLQFIFLIPVQNLTSVISVFQTKKHLSLNLQTQSQIHQKTIKLLI
ncbi:MAG: hypothetical protein ACO1NV_10670 [Leptospira bouyouniensis]